MSGVPTLAPSRLDGVPRLRDRDIAPTERWIYSAGFNVGVGLADTTRIDCELADLRRLADAGARLAILAHQGSYRLGTARPLDFAARHMERRLERPVPYFPDPLSPGMAARLRGLEAGTIAVVGNTRLLAGEETNRRSLARKLSRLGDRVAVGGFSKAHRVHASNVGMLRYLPGYATDSLVDEIAALEPWGRIEDDRVSVAALGGLKREKIDPGFIGLAQRYDVLVPGGAVLNALLAARGHAIGASEVGECSEATEAAAELLARGCRADVHLPEQVVVAPAEDLRQSAAHIIDVERGVPAGHAIVDFVLRPWLVERLAGLRDGRLLLAGPLGLYRAGFRHATDALLGLVGTRWSGALALGGDTAAELPWEGPVSGGGGSALRFLCTGTCPVLTALANGRRS